MGIIGVTKGDDVLSVDSEVGETAGARLDELMTTILCGLVADCRDMSEEERCRVSERRLSISMCVGAAPRSRRCMLSCAAASRARR